MFWEALILQAKTSTHSTYNIGDRASPCLTLLSNGIESDKKSLTRTCIYAALYRVAMQVRNHGQKPNNSSKSRKKDLSTQAKAFS